MASQLEVKQHFQEVFELHASFPVPLDQLAVPGFFSCLGLGFGVSLFFAVILLADDFDKEVAVSFVVHVLDDLNPLFLQHEALLLNAKHLVDLNILLEGVFLPDVVLQQLAHRFFDLHLHEPELFVALVTHNLPENCDVVVFMTESLDALYDGCCPLDDDVLKAVLCVQESVHVLLESLDGLLAFCTLGIKSCLRLVKLFDSLLELLDCQCPVCSHWLYRLHPDSTLD
mmetsp:Transcript_18650/g.33718  ORF Transcript_18650/g.33718 Transcript_18650/m.33718 type:complete len:228 (+) Transcript_18650:362-1045(+)